MPRLVLSARKPQWQRPMRSKSGLQLVASERASGHLVTCGR
ncbi:MAG: hypothetical protein ACI85K_002153, partial [Hyphomicrobiaceae bacterium]